ncbi:hypothetical protein OAV67_03200 [Alphaproteobacteria bacterium]|nr:hypothetical protein [Alphaproteobacteria bacterium]
MKEHLEQRIHDLAEYLIQLEQDAKLKKQKRAKSSVAKFHLSMGWLCKKLLASYVASAETGMRISKDKNRYTKGRYVPEGVTYDITIDGVLPLILMDGFVREVRKGSYDRTKGEGKQTRIAATGKLVDWFDVDPALLPKALVGCEDADPLVVQVTTKRKGKNKKGKTKTLKPYTDNAVTKQMRDNLNIINDCLKRHWSDLYLSDDEWAKLQRSLVGNKKYDYTPIRLHRQTIRRIFNSTSFDIGGRFYGGWWQNIPSAYRGIITIDGKRTTEFDYGRLHPTMLYAQEGMTLSEDAYDIGVGDEHRDVIKQLFNAMVQMKEPQDRPPRDVKFSQTRKTWKQLRSLIVDKHEPIKDKFFCGIGNRLQYEDSQIAEKVMLHFARQDIAVLPVHDSFVIQRSLQPELIDAMSKAFSQHYNVPIDIKDGAKFLAMDIGLPDEVEVEAIVTHMAEFDGWWRRNE